MDLGILVMTIIILINLIVVGAVMYFGSQHDTHTEIRHPEASKSVQILIQQAEAAARKVGIPLPEAARSAEMDLTPDEGKIESEISNEA